MHYNANSLDKLDVNISIVHLKDLIEGMHDIPLNEQFHELARTDLLAVNGIFCYVTDHLYDKELISFVDWPVEYKLIVLS